MLFPGYSMYPVQAPQLRSTELPSFWPAQVCNSGATAQLLCSVDSGFRASEAMEVPQSCIIHSFLKVGPIMTIWGFLTNDFLQANDTMQGHCALLHVISLVD